MREYSIGAPLGLEPNIPTELLERLAGRGTRQHFAANETIYRQGEAAERVYILLSGRAKTTLFTSSGHEALLRLHLPHNILGLTALASTPVRDADAVAIEAVETSVLARDDLFAEMRAEPRLAEYLLQLLVDRMTDFHYRVGEMFSQTVEQRLARALLSLSRPDPVGGGETEAGLSLTHEELAHLLNTRRPTVSAILNRFAQAGLIEKAGRRVRITDEQGLAALTGASAGKATRTSSG